MKNEFPISDSRSFHPDSAARSELADFGVRGAQAQDACYAVLAEGVRRAELPLAERLQLGIAGMAAAELAASLENATHVVDR